MGLFHRREETLNDKLLREAGYPPEGLPLTEVAADTSESEPHQGWLEQPSEVFATAEVPDIAGDAYEFVALPDGSLIVNDTCDQDLSRLADAVESQLRPPYSATAARQNASAWLVSARAIDVERIEAEGDDLQLTSVGAVQTFMVDGRPAEPKRIPSELIHLGGARSNDYFVRAVRIDRDLWEVQADPL